MRTSLILVVALFLPASSFSAPSPNLLRIGMVGEPTSLNPFARGTSEEGLINGFTTRTIAHFDEHSEFVAGVAKQLPVYKGNDLTFEIREDAKWADATPVVCEDFKTALSAHQKFHPNPQAIATEVSWKADRPKACRVKFRQRKAVYSLYIGPALPTKWEKPIIEAAANEDEYLKRSTYSVRPTEKGLANGPYIISAYERGQFIEFTRNPTYYGKAPRPEKVRVRFFSSARAMISSYETGELDLLMYGLSSEQADELRRTIAAKSWPSKVLGQATTRLAHLEFNLDHQVVGDVRVRKALSLMIDPNELAGLIGAAGELTGSLASFNDPMFEKDDSKPTFALRKKEALQLLKESGVMATKPALHLVYNSESRERELVATYLQRKWEEVGFKVNVTKHLKRVLLSEILAKGDFDVAVFGWSQPKLQINTGFFTAAQIPNDSNKGSGGNFARWRNPVAEAALKKADQEFEVSKIRAHMKVFNAEFRKDLPWLPLYFENRFVVAPKDLDYRINGDWDPETYLLENWRG